MPPLPKRNAHTVPGLVSKAGASHALASVLPQPPHLPPGRSAPPLLSLPLPLPQAPFSPCPHPEE